MDIEGQKKDIPIDTLIFSCYYNTRIEECF